MAWKGHEQPNGKESANHAPAAISPNRRGCGGADRVRPWQSPALAHRIGRRRGGVPICRHISPIAVPRHASGSSLVDVCQCVLPPSSSPARSCRHPGAGRAAGRADAICDHLLRRRAAHRAMAAQPRACGAHRRDLHLFPVLRLPAVARAQAATTGRPATRPANPMSASPHRRRTSPRGSQQIWLRHARKATRSPAMPAAISTAPTGARPTGSRIQELPVASSRTPTRSTASTASRRAGGVSSTPTVRGFRAPYLSTGKALYQALADAGYRL